jgi:tetratricopeptide (TPR) repeat protein
VTDDTPAERLGPWPRVPYRGFSAYGPGDRRLFAGREQDIENFARLITDVRSRIVLLQGETGCGKSSFLRAGLIPHLEGKARGYEFQKAPDEPSKTVFIRSTSDPLGRLAERVFEYASRPYEASTKSGRLTIDLPDIVLNNQSLEQFTVAVMANPQVLIDALIELAGVLPSTPVLIVDQGEEVLTLGRREARGSQQAFFQFLALLSTVTAPLKLIVTLRTEYFGRFLAHVRRSQTQPGDPREQTLPGDPREQTQPGDPREQTQPGDPREQTQPGDPREQTQPGDPREQTQPGDPRDLWRDKFRDYLLDTLGDAALVNIIKRPTLATPAGDSPQDQYHFTFAPDLPERIVRDIGLRLDQVGLVGGALPVLQVICEQLYTATKEGKGPGEHWTIKEEDYRRFELETVLSDYLDGVLLNFCRERGLHPNQCFLQALHWKDALAELAKTQADNTITTDLKSISDLSASVAASRPEDFLAMIEYLAHDDQSVLREELIQQLRFFSLRHDAIGLVLRRWKDARRISDPRTRRWLWSAAIPWLCVAGLATYAIVAWASDGRAALAAGSGLAVAGIGSIAFSRLKGLGGDEYRWYAQLYGAGRVAQLLMPGASSNQRVFGQDPVFRLLYQATKGVGPLQLLRDLAPLVGKGVALATAGRTTEATAVYDDVVRRAGDADDPGLRAQAARAWYSKGLTLAAAGQSEEALAAYNEVIRRYAGALEPALREIVANALSGKGYVLETLGRRVEEIATCDEVVHLLGESSEPADRERVAKALVNKGSKLETLDRPEEALRAYDAVVLRFGDASDPALREQVARALVNKGADLGVLERSEEAVAAYDEVVRRFGEAQEAALRDAVARALVGMAARLGMLGRPEEAVAICDEVVRRFGEASEPALRDRVARALVNKGVGLSRLDRHDESITAYDETLRRFGESSGAEPREAVARALFYKALELSSLGRSADAVATFDEVVRRFGDASDPVVREQVARALVSKGWELFSRSSFEDAVATQEEVVRRFGEASGPALREVVARALVNKGSSLASLGRSADAVATYDEVVQRFGDASDSMVREQVAKALVNRGWELSSHNRPEDAIATYEEVVRWFGEATGPALREAVARALLNKGLALGALGRHDEELAAYDEVVRRVGDATEAPLRQLAEMASGKKLEHASGAAS